MMPSVKKERQMGVVPLLFVLCAVYLALFCWLGFYAWPQLDDYSYFSEVVKHGFWPFQKIHYAQVNGRIFNVFLISLASLLPMEPLYWLFPVITIFFYLVSVRFFLTTLLPKSPFVAKWSWALLITSATLALFPSLCDVLYWRAGMPYFWTASFMMINLTLAIRALKGGGSKCSYWIGLALIFLNGTLLEPSCLMQGAVAFFASVFFLWRGDRRRALITLSFLLVSLLAFLTVYLAPGTAIRFTWNSTTRLPVLLRLIHTLKIAVTWGIFTTAQFFSRPIVYIFLLFLPEISDVMPVLDSRLAARIRARHIILIVTLTAFFMQAIGGWSMGGKLSLRVESLAVWMMGSLWCLLWASCYRQKEALWRIRLSRLHRWRWGVLFLYFLLSFNSLELFENMRFASLYRAECLARDQRVMEQRETNVKDAVIPNLLYRPSLLAFRDGGFSFVSTDYWQNQAYAYRYGLDSVIANVLPANVEDVNDVEDLKKIPESQQGWLALIRGFDTWRRLHDRQGAIQWYLQAAHGKEPLVRSLAARSLARLYFSGSRNSEDYLWAFYWLFYYEIPLARLL